MPHAPDHRETADPSGSRSPSPPRSGRGGCRSGSAAGAPKQGCRRCGQYEALKKQSQHLESDRKKLELDADALRDRIGKVRVQQNETRSNDQYKAYEHQIETSQREISRLEDQQLELMEQSETACKQLAIATTAYAALKAESDRQLADLVAREKTWPRNSPLPPKRAPVLPPALTTRWCLTATTVCSRPRATM